MTRLAKHIACYKGWMLWLHALYSSTQLHRQSRHPVFWAWILLVLLPRHLSRRRSLARVRLPTRPCLVVPASASRASRRVTRRVTASNMPGVPAQRRAADDRSHARRSLSTVGGDTQWPITPPVLSSHSPSFSHPHSLPERCEVSQQVWNRVMNWTWTCVSPYCDLLD